MIEQEKHKNLKERYVRWQQLSIKQLSFANNLVLTLTLGFLGFFATKNGLLLSNNRWIFLCQIVTLATTVLAFLIGLGAVLNRLYDFRLTAQIVNTRKEIQKNKKSEQISDDIEKLKSDLECKRKHSAKLGIRTWRLLVAQIIAFFFAIIFGSIFLLIKENSK